MEPILSVICISKQWYDLFCSAHSHLSQNIDWVIWFEVLNAHCTQRKQTVRNSFTNTRNITLPLCSGRAAQKNYDNLSLHFSLCYVCLWLCTRIEGDTICAKWHYVRHHTEACIIRCFRMGVRAARCIVISSTLTALCLIINSLPPAFPSRHWQPRTRGCVSVRVFCAWF